MIIAGASRASGGTVFSPDSGGAAFLFLPPGKPARPPRRFEASTSASILISSRSLVVTSASPKKSFTLKSKVRQKLNEFVVFVEINNSTDFTGHYTKEAKPGGPNFSGGSYGSGQPALVYSAVVEVNSGRKSFELQLTGHSSTDGEGGILYSDVSRITTAKRISKPESRTFSAYTIINWRSWISFK